MALSSAKQPLRYREQRDLFIAILQKDRSLEAKLSARWVLYIALGLVHPDIDQFWKYSWHRIVLCKNEYQHFPTGINAIVQRCQGSVRQSKLMLGMKHLWDIARDYRCTEDRLTGRLLEEAEHFVCRSCRKDNTAAERIAENLKEMIEKWREWFPSRQDAMSRLKIEQAISEMRRLRLCK